MNTRRSQRRSDSMCQVGEIPLFLGWIPLLILFGPHSDYTVGAIPVNLNHCLDPPPIARGSTTYLLGVTELVVAAGLKGSLAIHTTLSTIVVNHGCVTLLLCDNLSIARGTSTM